MNTVVFSIYDDFCGSSATLLKDGLKADSVRCVPNHEVSKSFSVIYDKDDFAQFDFFEDLFDETVDRIVTMNNEKLEKVRTKITVDLDYDKILNEDGNVIDSRVIENYFG